MSNLDTSAPSSYRLLLKGTLALSSVAICYGILSALTPTKSDFQHQVIEPYVTGVRAQLREETSGFRSIARSLFPHISESGRDLSSMYWDEISQKIDSSTTVEQFLFMSQFRTTWAWGIDRRGCETRSFGLAGKIWITSPDTCGLTTKGGA